MGAIASFIIKWWIFFKNEAAERNQREGSREVSDSTPLDYEQFLAKLRKYAKDRGIDFNLLVNRASQHFMSDKIEPHTKPFTEDELDALVAADKEFFSSSND